MKRQTILWILVAVSTGLSVLMGCHASEDDAAGQAGELSDPIRRQNAITNITNLYSQALAAARREHGEDANVRGIREVRGEDGRMRPGPKQIADDTIEQLVRTYTTQRSDTLNGHRILTLLEEMQDVRALPAYRAALAWRQDVTEEHAISAARGVQRIQVPDSEKGAVVDALGSALEQVQGNRPVDNRMRIEFIRALGSLHDRRATATLTTIATRLAEDQNFLINRLAAEQVGELGDPAAIPAMIKALFLFAPNDPRLRMNDVAAGALVQIGRPALNPLIELMRGRNQEANGVAQTYIRAVRQRDAAAASQMNPQSVVIEESCFALGQLGLREAIAPMMENIQPVLALSAGGESEGSEANRQTYSRALSCTTSLVQLNRQEADTPRLRETLINVYQRMPEGWPPEAPGASRSQLLAAMMHTYDPGLLEFLYGIASDRDGLPDFRVVAARSYAFLAAGSDVPRMRAVISREPARGEIRQAFEEMNPALQAATQCNNNVQCWIGKLGDSNALVVRKAAYMIARYGRGNQQALTALIDQIDHTNVEVRGDVLYAVDWVATTGSQPAVEAIDRLRTAEEGRSSWVQIQSLATAVRARLEARGAAH